MGTIGELCSAFCSGTTGGKSLAFNAEGLTYFSTGPPHRGEKTGALVATKAATQCLVSRGTRRVATRDPFPDTPPTYFSPPWYLELVPERKA